MFQFEDFAPGDRHLWEKLIEKEIGSLPQGRPLPFYMRDDVKGWETRQPLWQEAGWTLVSDLYIPDEVGVWRYAEPLPQPLPRTWFIPARAALPAARPGPEIEIFHEVPVEEGPSMVMGTAVWALPLRLTTELTWEGAESLKALPPIQPLHISLTLNEQFFHSILLLRSLRNALAGKGLHEVRLWAQPAAHLLEISPNLPGAGKEENLVRLTTYALSGILGGASYIYIPAIDRANPHAERWSRNISHILRYEVAYLFTTPDPLSGSFYIEAETDRLATELKAYLP